MKNTTLCTVNEGGDCPRSAVLQGLDKNPEVPSGSADAFLAPDQLETLRDLDACALADAIETFGVRLLNEGFMSPSIRCVTAQPRPLVGYAATLKIRSSSPPLSGKTFPCRTDWLDYLAALPSPSVLVIEDADERPGLGALIGVAQIGVLRALNCAGVVTNGSVRHLASAQGAGLYLFAGSATVSRGYAHVVEFARPIVVGGLKIQSGDLLHGDAQGVQSIPFEIAGQVPGAAAKLAAWQQELAAGCQAPGFSWASLRAAVRRRAC